MQYYCPCSCQTSHFGLPKQKCLSYHDNAQGAWRCSEDVLCCTSDNMMIFSFRVRMKLPIPREECSCSLGSVIIVTVTPPDWIEGAKAATCCPNNSSCLLQNCIAWLTSVRQCPTTSILFLQTMTLCHGCRTLPQCNETPRAEVDKSSKGKDWHRNHHGEGFYLGFQCFRAFSKSSFR